MFLQLAGEAKSAARAHANDHFSNTFGGFAGAMRRAKTADAAWRFDGLVPDGRARLRTVTQPNRVTIADEQRSAFRSASPTGNAGERDVKGPNKHQLKSMRTREMILDAAEPLFAPHGITGVSMRTIAKAAGVDLSLVTYHFKSKASLFTSVVDRLMSEFAERCWRALDRLERTNPNPTVFELFDVQLEAWLYTSFDGPAYRAQLIYNKLLHKSDDSSCTFWPSDEFVRRFIAALACAQSDKPTEFIHGAYHFLIGGLVYTLSNRDRISHPSELFCDVQSKDAIRRSFKQHIASIFGLEVQTLEKS